MTRRTLSKEYFTWLVNLVCEEHRFASQISYKKLLMHLHNTNFKYSIPKDRNRAEDGIDLRYRFAMAHGYENESDAIMEALEAPCSVLEMMVALAVRCEENIMDDPYVGNRTGQWFWGMINNLGLGTMMDDRFDENLVDGIVARLLKRQYKPNGQGGLFTIKDCEYDLRKVEIWHQLCWYLDSIAGY